MTDTTPRSVVALTAHTRHVPAIERKPFAQRLKRGLTNRALILETCHRVEAYAIGEEDGESIGSAVSLDASIDATAAGSRMWLEVRDGRAAAAALVARANHERNSEPAARELFEL